MGKADQMLMDRGTAIRDSATTRAVPLAMPSLSTAVAPADPRMRDVIRSKTAFEIPLSLIEEDPAGQVRTELKPEDIGRLADSLKANGVLHAPGVRKMPETGLFRVIYGHRRIMAARSLGWEKMPCKVWDEDLTPRQIRIIQGTENLSRVDLRPMDQARSFKALLDEGMTRNELAEQHGVSLATISQALVLIGLPGDLQELVANGTLPQTTAYHIGSKIEDPERQREVARDIVESGANRAESIAIVEDKATKQAKGKPAKSSSGKGRGGKPNPAKLPTCRAFRTSVGIKVEATKGKGFDLPTLADAIRQALATVEAEIAAKADDEAAD